MRSVPYLASRSADALNGVLRVFVDCETATPLALRGCKIRPHMSFASKVRSEPQTTPRPPTPDRSSMQSVCHVILERTRRAEEPKPYSNKQTLRCHSIGISNQEH